MSSLGGLARPPAEAGGPSIRVRVWLLGLLVLALFAILTAQLVRLQIINHDQYAARAAINRVRTVDVPPARGLIYARDGSLLVENVPRYRVTLIAGDIPDDEVPRVAAALADVFDLRDWEIAEQVLERKRGIDPFLPIVIEDEPEPGIVLNLQTRQRDLPGLVIESTGERRYRHGELLAHILGYVAPINQAEYEALADQRYRLDDLIGQTGVEAAYEAQLRGEPGWRQVEVDAIGRELQTLDELPPAPGRGVTLTIDIALQRQVRDILLAHLDDGGIAQASRYAAAVVLDVHTGEVLALASVPSYDVNIFAEEISNEDWRALLEDPGRPLRNHAIADQFAPGSIFKVVTALAGLEEGVIDQDSLIYSPGQLEVDREDNPDIDPYVFRDTTNGVFHLRTALAESSNVFFYYVAGGSPFRHPQAEPRPEDEQAVLDGLAARGVIAGDVEFAGAGPDALGKWAREFGLDSPTGIDLPGEADGLIPTRAGKLATFGESWLDGDSYNFGIGQGSTAVTPLQMAITAAAIANGGTILQPQVVREIRDADGMVLRPFEPIVASRMSADPEHLRLIGQGMALSVLAGTSYDAQEQLPSMMIAGKTGTAEFTADDVPPREDASDPGPTHGWFIGYAPYDDPKIAVALFFEFGAGFLAAEPAGQIMAAWAELSGEIATAAPPPRPRADLGAEENERVLRAVEERAP